MAGIDVGAGRLAEATTLVVEDDPPVASMLCYLLEEEGSRGIETRNAEQAWLAVQAEVPSAAVIDLRLPGKDGWWLLRQIRGEERTHRMPVVLITGFLDDEVAARAAELGCECLGKPFTAAALIDRLVQATVLAAALPAWRP